MFVRNGPSRRPVIREIERLGFVANGHGYMHKIEFGVRKVTIATRREWLPLVKGEDDAEAMGKVGV